MIDELAALRGLDELDADLLIVGAGAAGIVLAREFLGTRVRVLLVESGGLARELETDRLNEGEMIGMFHAGLTEGRGRVFGGSTTLWAGQCVPLDDHDFDVREWVPQSGWPIARADLERHYQAAGEVLGVPGETYDERLWRRWGTAPPRLDESALRHTYTAWAPRPDLGRVFRRELGRSSNVRVLLHANAVRIETNPSRSLFDHLVVKGFGGSTVRLRGRACVLCCGGVENARLLLASGEPDAGGLGNAHDRVGRFFQDHPNARVARIGTDRPEALQDPYSLFYRGRRRYLPKLCLAPEVQRQERVLNCAANLQYEFADEGLNALRRVYRGMRHRRAAAMGRDSLLAARALPAAAVAAYRRFARGRSPSARPSAIWLQVHSEQAPNPESRVVLSRQKDAFGSPQARVEWRLTDLERRTAEVMARTVAREFGRLSLGQVDLSDWVLDRDGDWPFEDSFHHTGTTRMAPDEAEGVVDANCQVHGVNGLYVGGSSVFPTSGFANPTLTIVALALRLAEHLRPSLN